MIYSCKMSLIAANYVCSSLRPDRFGVASGGDPVFGSYEIKRLEGVTVRSTQLSKLHLTSILESWDRLITNNSRMASCLSANYLLLPAFLDD